MRPRGICLDVGEIQIQRNEYSSLRSTTIEEQRIVCSREPLLGDGYRFKACFAKYQGAFRREIFVDFELQALVPSGRSTVPSRANSAA